MKERPILFSGPMVRAILAGRKTQTRRTVNPQPRLTDIAQWAFKRKAKDGGYWLFPNAEEAVLRDCPYGVPGDRIIFLTTWATDKEFNHLAPSKLPKIARIWSLFEGRKPEWCGRNRMGRFMPSVFRAVMPKGEITDVRVQRVQEISEADAMAEGRSLMLDSPVGYFPDTWDSINGKKHPWATNPWVWAITFKRI